VERWERGGVRVGLEGELLWQRRVERWAGVSVIFIFSNPAVTNQDGNHNFNNYNRTPSITSFENLYTKTF
jgi:hypothetical protein